MSFQIHSLTYSEFEPFFDLSPEQLAKRGAHMEVVTECPGTPCRVSMEDAKVGETVLLVNYEHQAKNSPYKATHAIFVRKNAEQAELELNEVPELLSSRLISIRGFDAQHFMREAEVVDGKDLSNAINTMFGNANITYIHLHNAKPGCFAAKVTRAE